MKNPESGNDSSLLKCTDPKTFNLVCRSRNSLVLPQPPKRATGVAADACLLLTNIKPDSMHQEAPCLMGFQLKREC